MGAPLLMAVEYTRALIHACCWGRNATVQLESLSTLPCEVPPLTFRANSSVHSTGNITINDTEQLLCIRSCVKSFTCYLPDLPKHYISQVRKQTQAKGFAESQLALSSRVKNLKLGQVH